jgi:hypothetical protein
MADHGCHVHDRPAATLKHRGDLVLQAEHHALDVHAEHRVEVGLGFLDNREIVPFDAGVVEGKVEPAVGRHRFLDERRDVGLVGNVGTYKPCLATLRDDTLGGCPSLTIAARRDDDGCACLGEGLCRCAADTGAASDYQRNSSSHVPAHQVGGVLRIHFRSPYRTDRSVCSLALMYTDLSVNVKR